jgi:molybdenum cofactor biosynthesis enzyme MoaA
LVFVNASEDLVMTTDVVMPSNPLVMPTKKEELEEPLLDVNVSQRSHDEEPFEKVVRTRADHSTWDC